MSFLEEKTKPKPLNKRRILIKVGVSAACGLAFAVIAAITFAFLEGKVGNMLEQKQTIVIEADGQEQTSEEGQMITASTTDVQKWQYGLYAKGSEISSALVYVGAAKDNCGMIISMEGTAITILVTDCPNVAEVDVHFWGGTQAVGTVSGRDSRTGIGIVSVNKGRVPIATQQKLTIVDFGNSRTLNRGQYVIAVGRPLENENSIVTGVVTGAFDKVKYVDREHAVINTDIPAKSGAEGFVISEGGALLGVITHQKDEVGEYNTLTAIGITDLVEIVEILANKAKIPYMGIEITTVSDEMQKNYKVPEGVYVDKVVIDSPAMIGNIQPGDVIVGIGKKEITTVKQLQSALMNQVPGATIKLTISRQMNGVYKSVVCDVVLGSID